MQDVLAQSKDDCVYIQIVSQTLLQSYRLQRESAIEVAERRHFLQKIWLFIILQYFHVSECKWDTLSAHYDSILQLLESGTSLILTIRVAQYDLLQLLLNQILVALDCEEILAHHEHSIYALLEKILTIQGLTIRPTPEQQILLDRLSHKNSKLFVAYFIYLTHTHNSQQLVSSNNKSQQQLPGEAAAQLLEGLLKEVAQIQSIQTLTALFNNSISKGFVEAYLSSTQQGYYKKQILQTLTTFQKPEAISFACQLFLQLQSVNERGKELSVYGHQIYRQILDHCTLFDENIANFLQQASKNLALKEVYPFSLTAIKQLQQYSNTYERLFTLAYSLFSLLERSSGGESLWLYESLYKMNNLCAVFLKLKQLLCENPEACYWKLLRKFYLHFPVLEDHHFLHYLQEISDQERQNQPIFLLLLNLKQAINSCVAGSESLQGVFVDPLNICLLKKSFLAKIPSSEDGFQKILLGIVAALRSHPRLLSCSAQPIEKLNFYMFKQKTYLLSHLVHLARELPTTSANKLYAFVDSFFIDESQVVRKFVIEGFDAELARDFAERVQWAHMALQLHDSILRVEYDDEYLRYALHLMTVLAVKYKSLHAAKVGQMIILTIKQRSKQLMRGSLLKCCLQCLNDLQINYQNLQQEASNLRQDLLRQYNCEEKRTQRRELPFTHVI